MATTPDLDQWFITDWSTSQTGSIILIAVTPSRREAEISLDPDGVWGIRPAPGSPLTREDRPKLLSRAVAFLAKAAKEM
jgi:hypothetical protein